MAAPGSTPRLSRVDPVQWTKQPVANDCVRVRPFSNAELQAGSGLFLPFSRCFARGRFLPEDSQLADAVQTIQRKHVSSFCKPMFVKHM